jgi:hypothetical protein
MGCVCFEVLEVLEVPEVMWNVLLCLRAVEGGLSFGIKNSIYGSLMGTDCATLRMDQGVNLEV